MILCFHRDTIEHDRLIENDHPIWPIVKGYTTVRPDLEFCANYDESPGAIGCEHTPSQNSSPRAVLVVLERRILQLNDGVLSRVFYAIHSLSCSDELCCKKALARVQVPPRP